MHICICIYIYIHIHAHKFENIDYIDTVVLRRPLYVLQSKEARPVGAIGFLSMLRRPVSVSEIRHSQISLLLIKKGLVRLFLVVLRVYLRIVGWSSYMKQLNVVLVPDRHKLSNIFPSSCCEMLKVVQTNRRQHFKPKDPHGVCQLPPPAHEQVPAHTLTTTARTGLTASFDYSGCGRDVTRVLSRVS